MRGKLYKDEIKKKAGKLRRAGKTYKEIRDLLGIPKSTLSVWLSKKYSGIFDREKQLKHLSAIRPLAIAKIKKRNEERALKVSEQVKIEIEKNLIINSTSLKLILAMLYSAEGARYEGVSGLKFVNTDPKLLNIFIALLRKCYNLDNKKFRVRLHLHYYHQAKQAKKYWSDLLGVPEDQFWKTYFKKRSKTKKFRKNFMGICFINYSDSDIRRELLELTNQFHDLLLKESLFP